MAETIAGFFSTLAEGQRARAALLQAGFPKNQLSFQAGDTRGHKTPDIGPVLKESESESGEDALKGAAIGLAVGMVTLFLPGIGPVLAAGPLAAYIGGMAGGAAIGELIGVFKDHGVSEEEAEDLGQPLVRYDVATPMALSNANQTLKTGKGESRTRPYVRSRMRPKAPVRGALPTMSASAAHRHVSARSACLTSPTAILVSTSHATVATSCCRRRRAFASAASASGVDYDELSTRLVRCMAGQAQDSLRVLVKANTADPYAMLQRPRDHRLGMLGRHYWAVCIVQDLRGSRPK